MFVQRIAELKIPEGTACLSDTESRALPVLVRLVQQDNDPRPEATGFSLTDYLELVDWSGRTIRDARCG